MNYVTFEPIGNYGNILFQYAFMRLFADRCNMLPRKPAFEQRHATFLNDMLALEDTESSNIDEFRLYGEHQCHGVPFESEHNYRHYWEGRELCKNARLSGYFQDSSYYENSELIKSYYNVPKVDTVDGVCLSLRLGNDFKSLNWVPEPNGVLELLKTLDTSNLTIIADTFDIGYINHFADFSPKVVCRESSEPNKDFEDLIRYKTLVIGNSTFSWWAAYLGNAEEVYMPSNNNNSYDYVKLNTIPGKKVKYYDVSY